MRPRHLIIVSVLVALGVPLSLNNPAFSAKELVLGRNVPIQKGAEFVVDNDWGAFERTVADRRPDSFPSPFNQISVEYSTYF
jgi:hypothetical protein